MSPSERDALAETVKRLGEKRVQLALGMSRLALARALAGLRVRQGTVALVRLGLQRLEADALIETHT